MRSEGFVAEVARLRSKNTFNPYADKCDVFDFSFSPGLRKSLLQSVVSAACDRGVDSLWVGRDLGYRGGRRTGLALTDQVHVNAHLNRWDIPLSRGAMVKGDAQAERTASVVWQMLDRIDANVFLWNVFPLHPHEESNPFSNRSHSAAERQIGEEVLSSLIQLLEPTEIVAIGQDAMRSVARCAGKRKTVSIRHPSYGGLRDFQRGVADSFCLTA